MTVFQPWALWSEEAGHSPQIPPHAFVAGLLEKARMKEGERLLDVGAGIGFISIPAAHQFEWPGSVVALEPADDSRRELARLSEDLGVDAIRVVGGEAERLPLGDSTVDAVIMRSVLIYVSDKAKAISEFHRVLRPGGRLVCSEPLNRYGFLRQDGVFSSEFFKELGELGRRAVTLIRKITEDHAPEMVDFTEHDLLHMCFEAGFRDVKMDSELRMRRRVCEGDDPLAAVGWHARGAATQPTPSEYLSQHLTNDEMDRVIGHISDVIQRREMSVVSYGGRCLIVGDK